MTKPLQKKKVRTHDDDEARKNIDSSSSSSSRGVIGGDSKGGEQGDTLALPLTYEEGEYEDLVQELTANGFDHPDGFIREHGIKRVKAAWESIKGKKPGVVSNPCGLLRYLVRTPGKIAAKPAQEEADKFIKGKYGHMVKR